MKSMILLAVLASAFIADAQEAVTNFNSKETFNGINLPAVVIKRVGEEVSLYLPEIENFDNKIYYMQNAFVNYELGNDFEGYDSYYVTFTSKDGELVAQFNENGKLVRVDEKYKYVRLPDKVVVDILKQYPEWRIVNNKFLYTQEGGTVTKKRYDVILQKENKTQEVAYSSKGELLKRK